MELQVIKPRNLTDKIVQSMSEADSTQRPELISEYETDSIYENPYSTHIYHDFGGSITPARNFINDQENLKRAQKFEKRKCYLLCLVLGLLTGVLITGLSIRFTIIEDLVISQSELNDSLKSNSAQLKKSKLHNAKLKDFIKERKDRHNFLFKDTICILILTF